MKGDLVLIARKVVQNHFPQKSSSGLSFVSKKKKKSRGRTGMVKNLLNI